MKQIGGVSMIFGLFGGKQVHFTDGNLYDSQVPNGNASKKKQKCRGIFLDSKLRISCHNERLPKEVIDGRYDLQTIGFWVQKNATKIAVKTSTKRSLKREGHLLLLRFRLRIIG
jgi:hypothetical protein